MLMTMKPGQSNKLDFSAARSLEGRVWEQISKNNIKQAIADCKQLNREHPDFASGWHTASQLAMKLMNAPLALTAIERALSIEPKNTEWLLQKGSCLVRLQQMEELKSLVEHLSSHTMKSAYESSAMGMLLTQLGQREEAVQHYEKAAALDPNEAKHYYNIGCLLRTLGDFESAEQNLDHAISLNPIDYESHKIRSDIRQQTPADNHVETLEKLVDSDIDEKKAKVHICYALAKELEDLGESERSFHYLKMGSDIRRRYMQYNVQRDLDTFASLQKTFNADLFKNTRGGDSNSEAIFVLGLPRTGTTLVERVLSSHSDVFAAGELNNFALQMTNLVRAEGTNEKIDRDELIALSAKLNFSKLGEAYIKSTRPLTGHTARFIDKMPLNYLYVGLIHLALPNSKIIILQRDPMDTCYAIYKQLFVDAYPFSYDLKDLAKYYAAYHELMEHWNTVLPGVIHTIKYEEVVNDLEKETRRLLEYCGLEWQAQCLQFHENKEASTTASTAQVRQPVYQSSVGKWRNYEKQLQPIVEILNQAGIK